LGKSASEFDDLYAAFLSRAEASFSDGLLAKQVSERFRRRCEHQFSAQLNSLSLSGTLEQVETQHIDELDPAKWETPPAKVFAEERAKIEQALANRDEAFHRLLPGKTLLRDAARMFGMTAESYVTLVCSALSATDADPLATLGKNIESALSDCLPPRRTITAA